MISRPVSSVVFITFLSRFPVPFSTRIPACKTAPFQLFVSLDFPFFARPKNYLRPSTLVG